MTFDFDTVHDRHGTDSSKWHRYPADVLPMFVADMDFRSPPVVIEALRRRVDHGFFGYGREPEELKEVAAERIGTRYNWEVEPEAIVPVPGVVVGVDLAVSTFTQTGAGVALQTPSYPPILNCPGKYGLVPRHARLVQDQSGKYTLDWEEFESALVPGTEAFVLCNPHNPVGRAFERNELERMGEACLRNGALIVSDEIHCDLIMPGHRHIPIASLSSDLEARTITFMAPSKTFNLPGLKTSIAIIPNVELRERYVAGRANFVRAPNILGIAAAVAAYREGDSWLQELLAYLADNRDYVTQFVASEMTGVKVFPAEATYLAWLDCRRTAIEGSPSEFFLEQARVGLSDGATFGKEGEGFVRLNFACPRLLLEEGLGRMARALRTIQ